MSQHHLYITILFLTLGFCCETQAQVLYPGDANRDSIANNIDVLYLGKAYGQTGAPRNSISILWESNDIPNPPWLTAAYDVPGHYSDCDGNGMVADADLEAIQVNYNSQYGDYSPVGAGDGEILRIDNEQDTVGIGEELIFKLILGEETDLSENVEGIAYTVRMGNNFLNYELQLNFSDDNNWFTEQSEQLHLLQIQPLGSMDVANTRIDQIGQTGFGEVSRLSAVIDKDLVGGMIDDYTPFTLEVENIVVSYSDRIDTLQGSMNTIYVSNGVTTALTEVDRPNDIKIFPNPASSHVHIRALLEPAYELYITDMAGQMKYHFDNDTPLYELEIPIRNWPNGVYVVHCRGKDFTRKEIFVKH